MTATPTTPDDLEAQIRQAIHDAHQDGRPAPGRPTLVRLTGATDHAVRRVLAHLATGHHQTHQQENDHHTNTGDPGATSRTPLALVTTHPGDASHQSPDPGDPTQHQATSPAQPNRQPTPPGGRLVAWTGFLFGSIMSIAANVLHAWLPAGHQPPGWTPGLAPQVGAAVWPIGLMLAVEALSRIRWPGGLGWGLARFGGAGTVALGSAVISYGHLRDVLAAWQYNPLAAAVGPLVLDGLMVVCGFALVRYRAACAGTSTGTAAGSTPSASRKPRTAAAVLIGGSQTSNPRRFTNNCPSGYLSRCWCAQCRASQVFPIPPPPCSTDIRTVPSLGILSSVAVR